MAHIQQICIYTESNISSHTKNITSKSIGQKCFNFELLTSSNFMLFIYQNITIVVTK